MSRLHPTSVAGEASSDIESVRGAPLREFTRFLTRHDADGHFSNLRRVVAENGMSLWTTDEGTKAIERERESELNISLDAIICLSDPRPTYSATSTPSVQPAPTSLISSSTQTLSSPAISLE